MRANVTILDGHYVYTYATIFLPSMFCTTYSNLYDVTFTLSLSITFELFNSFLQLIFYYVFKISHEFYFLAISAMIGPNKKPRPNSAGVSGEIYPQRPGEKMCAYYMTTRTCSFGETCRYDHPTWVPIGGIPNWKEVEHLPFPQICNCRFFFSSLHPFQIKFANSFNIIFSINSFT